MVRLKYPFQLLSLGQGAKVLDKRLSPALVRT